MFKTLFSFLKQVVVRVPLTFFYDGMVLPLKTGSLCIRSDSLLDREVLCLSLTLAGQL